jgi:hypothetical protein
MGLGNGSYSTTFVYNFYGLREIRLGTSIQSIASNGITSMTDLEVLTIPKNVSNIITPFMYSTNGVKHITIPRNTVITNGGSGLIGGISLQSASLPPTHSGKLNSGNNFGTVYNLKRLILPEGMTDMGSFSLAGFYAPCEIVLPSTITSWNSQIMTDYGCKARFYAPDDKVSTYKSMTNLSKFADKIFPISDLLYKG